MQRKTFLKNTSLAGVAMMLAPIANALSVTAAKPKVLVRSGWQTVNIGDIGHTFGLLQIMQDYLPEVEVILWPKSFDRGVEELLRTSYPKLQIVKSPIDSITPELKTAFTDCAFMVHSSGPYVTADKELRSWWEATHKPFGIYGVSLDEVTDDLAAFLQNASFMYCRDTDSLKYLKTLNLKIPIQEFAPDSTFGIKVYNDAKAQEYLDSVGLKKGEFICVIPRMRYTPYWQMMNREPSASDKEKYAITLAYRERDAEKMRNVITDWIKATGLKVLICAEVTYQVPFGKETLYDPLPEDIKKNAVWRSTFWLPDEATSVYKHSRALVCSEPHSLIMAVANGIPSIHMKQATDTRKGQMWEDIGLGDWYFRMDEIPASQISRELLKIHNDYPAAQKLTNKAMAYVRSLQKKTIKSVKTGGKMA